MDFYLGRSIYSSCRHSVFLGYTRFSGYRQIPNRARKLVGSQHDIFILLTDRDEGTIVINRLQSDQQFSARGEKFQMKYVKQSLTDVKTWLASTSV